MKKPNSAPPETHPSDLLTESKTLLTTLLTTHLPQIQAFRSKWSLIKAKLAQLSTHLTDFADFPVSLLSNDSLSVTLLSSVSLTLAETLSLADKCRLSSDNLTDGKLKTQSDIDSVLARLDRHVKDSEILIRSGVLQDKGSSGHSNDDDAAAAGDAIALAGAGAVGPASKKEAVRVEMRNLLTRLQIGCSQSKNTAMDSVLRLLHEDDKNVMIAVAQGIVPVLVRLLDSNSVEMKEKSVAALSRVSILDSSKHVLIAEGLLLLNHLVRIVESGSVFAKEKACVALQALSFSKENARSIGSRGGISALLDICVGGTPGSQAVAAGVLRNLAQFEDTAENFMEENALSVLIPLTGSGTALARENAMGCLSNLVRNDENLKLVVAREGGIDRLKDYWDSTPPVGRPLEPAVELLKNLASLRPVGDILIRQGFIGRLYGVLSCGVMGVRVAAAGAVYELGKCGKARREIGDARCIPPLVRMLEGKATEEREAAARALSKVLVCDHNKKLLKKEERGVMSLAMLLDPMTQKNLDKKYVVSALSALASGSNKCRKMMVDANACVYLQKLVDLGDVDGGGAKKLLECLGGGRGKVWWGVFGRN